MNDQRITPIGVIGPEDLLPQTMDERFDEFVAKLPDDKLYSMPKIKAFLAKEISLALTAQSERIKATIASMYPYPKDATRTEINSEGYRDGYSGALADILKDFALLDNQST